jgi:predicted enzyme related to lactoylglutathione lyase
MADFRFRRNPRTAEVPTCSTVLNGHGTRYQANHRTTLSLKSVVSGMGRHPFFQPGFAEQAAANPVKQLDDAGKHRRKHLVNLGLIWPHDQELNMAHTDTDLSSARVGQASINVHDLEQAMAFYRDTLGLHFLFQAPKMAFFDCAGLRLMLAIPERAEFDHPSSVFYFKVDDIQAVTATLQARGVQFDAPPHLIAHMPDHDLWMAFFRDVDRNLLALMSEVPRG